MEVFRETQDTGIIKKLYQLYEATMADIDVVCGKACADCCTCNVVVTSLEAAFLIQSLSPGELACVKQRLKEKFPGKRYIPKMTTNQFAMYCMTGQEIPQEENNPDWGKCPFLEADLCTIYPARPFGCRCMMSQVNCRKTGYAEIPPLALTIIDIFLQYIEHIDHQGFSANLSDTLGLYLRDTPRDKELVIKNLKIQALMIPPEHRSAVAPLLQQIAALTYTP
jgi:Fe-S-cluster containining protein